MAFSFRKTVRIGGIRLILSQSGIRCSCSPIKEFRITARSRGTAGSSGFDYRERLDKPIQGIESPQESPVPNAASVPIGDVSPFIDVTSHRLIAELNRRKSTIRVAPILGGMLGFLAFVLVSHDFQLIGLIAVMLTVVTASRAAQYDKKQRTTFLHYDLGDGLARFAEKQRICQLLLRSDKVWRVQQPALDQKTQAGADSPWSRKEVAIGKRPPPCIETNVETWGIDAGSMKLYFLPDYLFVLRNGRYDAISYESLTAHVSVSPFIERSSLPTDASIAGYTWKHVRSDGEPDRRFYNNRQLPITMYGLLILDSAGGLNIWLQCSNQDAAKEAAEQVEDPKPQTPETQRNWEPPSAAHATAKADYDMLQVAINATDEEIMAAYLRLAQMYHPDKVEGLAPEYKVIAITRMKELNDAYARLKSRQHRQ